MLESRDPSANLHAVVYIPSLFYSVCRKTVLIVKNNEDLEDAHLVTVNCKVEMASATLEQWLELWSINKHI